jgi:hypothetical protein
MIKRMHGGVCVLSIAWLLASNAGATTVPSLSFEEMTDRSELVVSGQVARSWTDWDSEHKYIWTHYELTVSATHKGTAAATLILSEPGGVVGIEGLAVAGAVGYLPGERVLVFLERMPNGYLRTTGWSQGKYDVDAAGRLHPESTLGGVELVNLPGKPAVATPLRILNGMSVAELHGRIAARLKSQGRTQ